jgi:hypothetical protein
MEELIQEFPTSEQLQDRVAFWHYVGAMDGSIAGQHPAIAKR